MRGKIRKLSLLAGSLFLIGSLLFGMAQVESYVKGKKFWYSKPETQQLPKVQAYDFSKLVEEIKPAVFNISVKYGRSFRGYRRYRHPEPGPNWPRFFEDPFFRFFKNFRPFTVPLLSKGTGFLINEEGYALTNYHVVKGGTTIKAQLDDGREFDVKVIGKAPLIDLALIKLIAPKGVKFPFVYLGDSDKLKVGEAVIAIGNAKGLGLTVTAGIVSAIGRVVGTGMYDYYIQTDAAINRGNSGGPLFNKRGEVIGINTAILRGAQGIGFAIPINIAKRVLPQLKEKGKVERAQLGVYIQKVTSALAKTFGLDKPRGALVTKVMPGTPAKKAGIKPGDIILEVNGIKVRDQHHLPVLIAFRAPGEKIRLKILRKRKIIQLDVRLAKWGERTASSDEDKEEYSAEQAESRLGISVRSVPSELIDELGLPRNAPGVLVKNVRPDGVAAQHGIDKGDIILEVNQEAVKSPRHFAQLVQKIPRNGYILLRIARRDGSLFVAFRLP